MANKIYIYVYAKKTLDRYAAWQIRLSVQYWIFDARIQVYICDTRMRALQSLSSAVIYIKKYDSLHGHSCEFRSSCTCTTNNKQWSAAEIACPMCSTPTTALAFSYAERPTIIDMTYGVVISMHDWLLT